jgi:hypothetical protein
MALDVLDVFALIGIEKLRMNSDDLEHAIRTKNLFILRTYVEGSGDTAVMSTALDAEARRTYFQLKLNMAQTPSSSRISPESSSSQTYSHPTRVHRFVSIDAARSLPAGGDSYATSTFSSDGLSQETGAPRTENQQRTFLSLREVVETTTPKGARIPLTKQWKGGLRVRSKSPPQEAPQADVVYDTPKATTSLFMVNTAARTVELSPTLLRNLSARVVEDETIDRQDVENLEQLARASILGIVSDVHQRIIVQNAERRAIHLMREESEKRHNIVFRWRLDHGEIEDFLGRWMRIAKEQNDVLITEKFMRSRLETEESEARCQLKTSQQLLLKEHFVDWHRTRRLNEELLKASSLHRQVVERTLARGPNVVVQEELPVWTRNKSMMLALHPLESISARKVDECVVS